MKFSIGDKILLKRTDEEGVVTGIVSKDMFEVRVNGTTFPVHKDDIDHPYLKWFTQKKQLSKTAPIPEQLPVEKASKRIARLSQGIYLSFLPVFEAGNFEDVVDHLKIHLINETPHTIHIDYEVKIFHESHFHYSGSLHPFADLYLHNVAYEDMNDQPRFHWQLSSAKDPGLKKEEGLLKIKPQKLFQHIQQLLSKNEPMFNYLLIEDFVLKPKEEKKELVRPSILPVVERKSLTGYRLDELPRYELDLHIEQLADDYKDLSNAEIIHLQLSSLQRYLSLAILHRQERMIIIHGVGKGKLKEEVHHILKQIPEIKRFSNEWLGKYGFGATEVIFQY
ncbi:MAG TPA: Smr/MutS family protein [Flavipsychrobacter sp.]|nr:Smr/MutS family protein [Flavipsychrobacter sp.]